MIRHLRWAAWATIAVLPAMTTAPAGAQLLTLHPTFRALDSSDVETLKPIIREALSNDAANATRRWESPSGRRGFVQLLEGGTQAGINTGMMRITVVRADLTTMSLVFRYPQDAKGQWRSVG